MKPVTPRQVYALGHAPARGPRIRQQAVARALRRPLPRDAERVAPRPRLARVDRPLPRADAVGPRSHRRERDGAARVAARALSRSAPRVRAVHDARRIRAGSRNLEGDRPPLSIDIVRRVPAADRQARTSRRCSSSSTACASISGGCSSRSSRRCSTSRRRTTSACCRRRRRTRATRCSADSFPARSRRASPTGGASARTRRSTRTSASCSRRSSSSSGTRCRCATRRSRRRTRRDELERRLAQRDRARRDLARSSSTSSTCSRTAARSRRSCTRWRATRSRCGSSRCSGSSARRCSACCRKRRAGR